MDRHLKVRTHPPVLFEHCIQMTTTTKKDNTEDKQSMSPLSEPVVIAEEQERTKKTAPVTKKEQKEEAQQKVKSSTTTTKSREQFFTIFLCAVTNIWQHHPKVEKEKQNAKEVRKLETIFDLSKLPSVSLPDFVIRSSLSFFFSFHFYILSFLFGGVGRIHKYCEPSIEAWVLSMCYLEILHVKHPSFPIHMLSVHQLILTSCMIATKYFDDNYIVNKVWAEVGGVKLQHLNTMEVELLQLLNWELHVSQDSYWIMVSHLSSSFLHQSTHHCTCLVKQYRDQQVPDFILEQLLFTDY